jgi:hypothetical protein
VQSQSEQAHGSVPLRSLQRDRACASCTFHQIEVLFPVRPLFLERRGAVAHLDPLHRAVAQAARAFHVAHIFVARDRAGAKRALFDRLGERLLAAGLDARRHQITHPPQAYDF